MSDCDEGYFYNSSIFTCVPCSSNCAACNSTSTSVCTKCKAPTPYLLNSTCYASCPGKYTESTSLGTCVACDTLTYHCENCSVQTYNCTSCDKTSPFGLLFHNQCIQSCPVNTTVSINGNCLDCDSNCLYCAGQTNNCTQCANNLNLDLRGNTCVSTCEVGKTIVELNTGTGSDLCLPCSSNCNTCSSLVNTCTSCISGSVLR